MTPCSHCDGDGYTERWNDEQTGVVITPCEACGATGTEGGPLIFPLASATAPEALPESQSSELGDAQSASSGGES